MQVVQLLGYQQSCSLTQFHFWRDISAEPIEKSGVLSLIVRCPALLVGFVVVAVEGIGDITATEEASMLATTGSAHSRRIQGGILADGAQFWDLDPAKCLPGN